MITLMILGALALYLTIAIVLTKLLVRQGKSMITKWSIGIASALVFFLVPTWDEIAGRIYFRHLCETEGGVKVNKVVELPDEYWTPEGRPRFIKQNGDLDEGILSNRYVYRRVAQEKYVPQFRIDKERRLVVDRETDEVVGETVLFRYWMGWLINSTGLHVTATRCDVVKGSLYQDFFRHIFKPKRSAK